MTRTADSRLVSARFTLDDAQRARDEWNFSCGPAALAVVSGLTLQDLRPQMGDFESKGYTNPTLMFDCLNRLGINWKPRKARGPTGWHSDGLHVWPRFGLCRVQWEGPWMAPGVPIRPGCDRGSWVSLDRGGLDMSSALVPCCSTGLVFSGPWIYYSPSLSLPLISRSDFWGCL
jgi:hypothetical protein